MLRVGAPRDVSSDGDDRTLVVGFACASLAGRRVKFRHGHPPGTAFRMNRRALHRAAAM